MAQATLDRKADVQEVEKITYEELKNHPEMILDILEQDHASLTLKRQGKNVHLLKESYDSEFVETMQRVETELAKKKQAGYTRQKAFQDFREAQANIIQHIQSHQ